MYLKHLLPVTCLLAPFYTYSAPTAKDIVQAAIDNWRGTSSYSEMSMTIHRPSWQRSMSMKGWTQGDDKSLVRITQPKKDANNGTLMIDNQMWTYTPKINRVIKIPSSMMNQSWMGSDFSNKDISRADDIVKLYRHELKDTTESSGKKTYTIAAIPYEDAAVVWGKEVLKIREDYVLLLHQFYDQDNVLVKQMESFEIKNLSGRPVATRQRMTKADKPQEWTEIKISQVQFDIEIPEHTFTRSNLRNPGR